jgi:hypothetical protein
MTNLIFKNVLNFGSFGIVSKLIPGLVNLLIGQQGDLGSKVAKGCENLLDLFG